ncbi:MAG TPA: glycosyltransferase family 4 protein [Solirubrobacteraceae bacterium]|nr:glycosyltransferase family 4 protein [Solirubrobacteraceae bacterium]
MRILVTVPWHERLGGAEAMLQTIIDGLGESGHEMELVFLEDGSWPAELRDAGLRVDLIEAGRVRQLHRWLATVLRLAALFRRRRPDVILNWAAKTQVYGSPAAALVGMSDRVVWWQHSIAQQTWLERIANLLPARAIVCYSAAAARAQARMFPARPTLVIPAGAAPAAGDAPAAAPLELPPGDTLIGIVGRLQPWKGQDRLLAAQAMLRDRGHHVHLVIVGGDAYGLSPEYAASLPGLVAGLGLTEHVTMTGEVADARPFIEQLDVLVNASDPEPFGIVLLEGMAAAVPVVAVDAGGPAEIVEHGKTGRLARSGAPEDLADALEPLVSSAALRHRLGQAGVDRFLREYSDVAMRKRFFTTLEGLVADRTKSVDGR